MNYEQTESDIVQKLQFNSDLIAIADVMILPDDVDSYKTPTIKGLVTVVFMSEKFDNNQSAGQISQHTTVTFNVSVRHRKLRGANGVYAISELVKKSLLGFSPSDCGPFSLGEHSFADWQNDVWEHSVTFAARSLRTQETAESVDYPITNEEVFYKSQTTNENIHL